MLFRLLPSAIRHLDRLIYHRQSVVMYSDAGGDSLGDTKVRYKHLSKKNRSDIQYMIDNSIECFRENTLYKELTTRPTYDQMQQALDAQRKAMQYMIQSEIKKALINRPTYYEIINQIDNAIEGNLKDYHNNNLPWMNDDDF